MQYQFTIRNGRGELREMQSDGTNEDEALRKLMAHLTLGQSFPECDGPYRVMKKVCLDCG